jgi:DNA-directed RNA polymerase beta subunit
VQIEGREGPEQGEEDDGVDEIELAPGISHYVCPRVYLTSFPVMVGSRLCRLYGLPVERLIEMGELIHEPNGMFIMRGKERILVPQKNMTKNMLYVAVEVPVGQDGSSSQQLIHTGTIHCCGEASEAQRVVNKIIVGYEKEYQDIAVRVSVTQVFAGKTVKGVPVGVLLAALGMPNWFTVVETVAAFARVDIETMTKLLHASCLQAQACFAEASARSEEQNLSNHRAAWNWLADKVSVKQRIKTRDPLPEHPTEPKKTAAYSVLHYWLYPHVMDGMPNVQVPEDYWSVCRVKAMTMCMHVALVLRVYLGLDQETDKDRMETKRWESPGSLITNLFRTFIRPQMSEFRTQIITMDKNKKPIDIVSAMCSERLQKGLSSGLQTGKFTISKRSGGQSQQSAAASASTGVSQPYPRLNATSASANMRKVAAPGNRKTPANARQLHTSQWALLCPYETPEGQPCGIVNHLAMTCNITCDFPSRLVIDWIRQNVPHSSIIYETAFNPKDWRILINSRVVFSFRVAVDSRSEADEDMDWIERFKAARFAGELPRDISIAVPFPELREVRIYCDGGRLTRPLCVVRNGALMLTSKDIRMLGSRQLGLDDLFMAGKLEMVDGAETEDSWVATFFSETKKGADYTHCEMCPVSILGTSAALIPFAERNQSPRNVYQSAMCKQAFGTPSIPLSGNMRPTDHVLEHTEHPLVDTVLQSVENMSFEWMPCGQNCVVFVDAYSHNVEDSLVMNADSVQAGFMASFTDRTYVQTAQRNTHHNNMESEVFERPNPEHTANYKTEAYYDKIGSDGLPVPGEMVTDDTVLIGKTGPLPTPPQDPSARNRSIDRTHMYTDPSHTRKDLSTLPRKKGGGLVTEVTVSHTRDNKRASVTIRRHRKPQIGDKFSSRHGQKGIVARVARADELPVTLDGLRPDIIMNPHAYPSRMTGAQVTEAALGKVAASTGVCRDATIFFGPSKDEIAEQLYMLKLDPDSEQRVLDPKTGELTESAIYTGVVYYQCLKHLVEEKVHARNRGPVTKLNKQPVEGRRREGGLRIGEMEKETMIAHGAAALGLERTCEVSDAFRIPVCMTCGGFAHREKTNHVSHHCPNCDSRDNIRVETIPYVLKQLFSYLYPLGIDPSLVYGNRGHDVVADDE